MSFFFVPARLRDLKRVLEALGVSVEEPRSGSHFRATRDGLTYPIPAHNGLRSEIGDAYVRGVCRTFGLDYERVKRAL